MSDKTFTRDEAIRYLVGSLSTLTVEAGGQLAQVLGAELAAELTVREIDTQRVAFEALGVSVEDVRRVSEAAEAERQEVDFV